MYYAQESFDDLSPPKSLGNVANDKSGLVIGVTTSVAVLLVISTMITVLLVILRHHHVKATAKKQNQILRYSLKCLYLN